uniref:acid phosphatase n=1 Tax=Bursaphelenchus xylophilus TaxID=6326 RepID=A0A1I7RMD8_BURXY
MPWPLTAIVVVLCCCSAIVAFAIDDQDPTWSESLVHATVLFRHGARSPMWFIPNDFDNRLETWPEGLSALTALGRRQMLELGRVMRQRYGHFVDDQFSPQEVYVRSTANDRTLISANIFLSGFYERQKNESKFGFVAVPVHTKPVEEDKELTFYVKCPTADDIFEKLMYENDKFINLAEKSVHAVTYLSRMGGFSKVPLPLRDFVQLYDPLKSEKVHNRQWPYWINESLFDEIERSYDIGSYLLVDDDRLKRLRVGPLYKEILERIENINSNGSTRKMHLYSCHDTTLGGILATLGMEAKTYPQFGASLIIEFHKNSTSNWLRFFYREGFSNSTNFDELFPKNCLWPCSLEKLHGFVRPFIPQNWEAECGFDWAIRREKVLNHTILTDNHDVVGQTGGS